MARSIRDFQKLIEEMIVVALAIPAVTVLVRPRGLPIAMTHSPTRSFSEAPYGTVAVFEDLYGNRWDLIQLNQSVQ